MGTQGSKTSALLIIGNEILSGRTQDKNIQHIAQACAVHGTPLLEVRVVADIEDKIIAAVNAMRAEYDYVFTTGGIGPTHDDITAMSIAKAFDVQFGRHAGAYDILHEYYGADELNYARASMADMPIADDMDLIANPVSAAPGFRIGNVFVMAGVPKIMQAMFVNVLDMIEGGAAMISRSIEVQAPESRIADILRQQQAAYSDIDIGSYPQFKEKGWGVTVVLRGLDDTAMSALQDALLSQFKGAGISVKVKLT